SLGNGEFDLFYKMAEPVVCARAVMTPETCVAETERLIAAALYHRRPAYMAFPSDLANMPVTGEAGRAAEPATDAAASEAAVKAIGDALSADKNAFIFSGIILCLFRVRKK